MKRLYTLIALLSFVIMMVGCKPADTTTTDTTTIDTNVPPAATVTN